MHFTLDNTSMEEFPLEGVYSMEGEVDLLASFEKHTKIKYKKQVSLTESKEQYYKSK